MSRRKSVQTAFVEHRPAAGAVSDDSTRYTERHTAAAAAAAAAW
jgi:hypothetical protein